MNTVRRCFWKIWHRLENVILQMYPWWYYSFIYTRAVSRSFHILIRQMMSFLKMIYYSVNLWTFFHKNRRFAQKITELWAITINDQQSARRTSCIDRNFTLDFWATTDCFLQSIKNFLNKIFLSILFGRFISGKCSHLFGREYWFRLQGKWSFDLGYVSWKARFSVL